MVKHVYFNLQATGYNLFNGMISIIMLVQGMVILLSALRKCVSCG